MTIINHIRKYTNSIIDLFYPKVCVTCDALLLPDEALICHHCQSDLPLTYFHLDNQNQLYDRLSAIVKIEAATSLLLFDKSSIVKELIHQLKYQNRQEIGNFLGKLLAKHIQNDPVVSQIDYIIPVPLHAKKQKKRGYNQMTIFGKTLQNELKIEYNAQILLKTVNNQSQTTKTAAQRRKNVAGVYQVQNPEKYQNKHFLIIDDVMTTGATIEACAESILQQIEGAKVSVLTMAVVL